MHAVFPTQTRPCLANGCLAFMHQRVVILRCQFFKLGRLVGGEQMVPGNLSLLCTTGLLCFRFELVMRSPCLCLHGMHCICKVVLWRFTPLEPEVMFELSKCTCTGTATDNSDNCKVETTEFTVYQRRPAQRWALQPQPQPQLPGSCLPAQL